MLVKKEFKIEIEEYESIKLSCIILNHTPDDIFQNYWMVNGSFRLDSNLKDSGKYILDSKDFSLTIRDIQLNDECSLDSDHNSYLTRIEVNVKPQFILTEWRHKIVKSIINETIVLDCAWWWNANEKNSEYLLLNDNNKESKIEWFVNDLVLAKGKNIEDKFEFQDDFNTILKINHIDLSENLNNYTCKFKIKQNHLKESIFEINVGGIKEDEINLKYIKL